MGFQAGLSGLNTASKNLDVIGNNVANANAVGYKGARATFGDVFANSLGSGASNQIGIGTKIQSVLQEFSQGNISVTNNPLDIAINGKGFFRMSQSGAITYSRNGQFRLDNNGYVVNTDGLRLTGYAVDSAGNIVATSPVDMQISNADISPQPTTTFSLGLNLDARSSYPSGFTQGKVVGSAAAGLTITLATNDTLNVTVDGTAVSVTIPPGAPYASATALATAVQTAINANATLIAAGKSVTVTQSAGVLTVTSNSGGAASAITGLGGNAQPNLLGAAPTATAGTGTFNPLDPTTFTSSTSGTVYDSLGNSHTFTTYFVKTAAASGVWNMYGTIDGTALSNVNLGAGAGNPVTLSFNSTGALTTAMPITASLTVATGAVTPLVTSFSLLGSTQYGSIFGVNSLNQDGFTSGRLAGFSVSPDGIVQGRYSNGKVKNLGQIVLVNFNNQQGLSPLGSNQWAETSASGLPIVGVPASGSLGALQAAALEDSNIDLTAELVSMITAQRVYQANAQTIKTLDQVLQTLVNLR